MQTVQHLAAARSRSGSAILSFTASTWGALWASKASDVGRDVVAWGPQQLHQQQQYAATADGSKQSIPLKTALRQLYKRVHPDLFTDYPAEQAENERSFKLLQDYLHQARSPTTGPASRTAYNFRFYLMSQGISEPAASQSDDGTTTASSPPPGSSSPFKLAQLSLPPPQPNRRPPVTASAKASGSSSGQLSAPAARALVKLLELCGITGVAMDSQGDQQDVDLKLTTFIPEAAEVVRQHESGVSRHEVQVANIRAAIRLSWQVVAGLQRDMFLGEQQVQLLQRLTQALNILSDQADSDQADLPNLSGLHILITDKTYLNSQGTLCLDASDSADDWADCLGGVDADYARDKKSNAAAVRQLESQVAAAVGVRMLFTAGPYLMTHEYRQFLERLAAHSAEHGPVQPPRAAAASSSNSNGAGSTYSSVPVYVAPPYQYPQQASEQQQQVVHESVGYIMVKMDDSAQQIYHTVQVGNLLMV
eukprot:GHUV01023920.1.p1 GENE.GHUV01023920.1~~GHUV01023920.1.p1  ORF type:complete len:478 (+),score=168.44 GHUV01023920.1:402-1835(+)